jgi:AcrR family transcriptional regulator
LKRVAVERAKPDRRARIAAAAKVEFARFGYAGARVNRIVERAGVNKQLLFYYFGSKAGLYRAVMEESRGRLTATTPAVQADARATKHLSQELRSAYAALSENPNLVRLIAYDAWAGGVAREMAETVISDLRQRISAIVTRGQGLGYFRDDADPDTTARQAVGLILGRICLEHAVETTEKEDPSEIPTQGICEMLLRYLEW